MAMVKTGRLYVPVCDCCGCRGRMAQTEAIAARWAHIGRWDTPGPEAADDCCAWWFRCPKCVKANRWPLDCDGWQEAGVSTSPSVVFHLDGDGPTIRLADGDLTVTGPLDALHDALVG